jgi:hypothetical protein
MRLRYLLTYEILAVFIFGAFAQICQYIVAPNIGAMQNLF